MAPPKKTRGGRRRKPREKPVTRERYTEIDLDILVVAYSVHVNLKHTPAIPAEIVGVIEQEKMSWADEEDVRGAVCDIIDKHVVNKRNFAQVLAQAQRKRFFQKRRGIHWDAYPLASPNQEL
uniref:Uncharacterized protein n=1 Tax=viral metagenome TaxID=1070528 RepID=A0A6C0BLU7_9ZZZZ